jgi:alpha-amylase/alpha-mannosidase (GH57 family)
MERFICIHGHFYQPPRENAWLEFVEIQDSAYPFHDWNERVTAECYGPNGTSRILDGFKNVERIVNNYAYISFNFGPTVLAWLAEREPEVYRKILEADRESQAHCSGHGSAIAQSYNHTILPLSSSRDKYTQLFWGLRDFQHRFGRNPEGMWLPETAVDLEVLEILVQLGIKFTILSPFQARRTKLTRGRAWKDVNGGRVDPSTPYVVKLPSGKRITVFFYDGPISHAVAFENLLERGENFASRLMSGFNDHQRRLPQLVHIATDGETYGHHHKQGEMALAYAIHHIQQNNLAKLTNYGEYLSQYTPVMEAEIWERSAWSCSHGVERWNSNCGCNSGVHAGWNQEWRLPLRQSLDWLRDRIGPRFEEKAGELFSDPWKARNEYINVVLNREPEVREKFFASTSVRRLSDEQRITGLKLLEMQRHAMLMYTSCGWFFDELSGIETTQIIQYAARALQLYGDVFGESIEEPFLQQLEKAKSNIPEHKDGRTVFNRFVKPAMVHWKDVAAHFALSSLFEAYPERAKVYCYDVDREDLHVNDVGRARLSVGRARITSEITTESAPFSFGSLYTGDHLMNAGVRAHPGEGDYNALKQALADPFARADFAVVLNILERHFGESIYSLRSIFHDEQRKIVDVIMKSTLEEAENVYRQLYEKHAPMMRFMADLRIPLPRAYQVAADFALNSNLRHVFEDPDTLDFTRIGALLEEVRANNVNLDGATLGFALRETIRKLSEQLLENPDDLDLLRKFEATAEMARALPFEVSVWRAQNNYYAMLQRLLPEKRRHSAREWVDHFVALGRHLSMKVEDGDGGSVVPETSEDIRPESTFVPDVA